MKRILLLIGVLVMITTVTIVFGQTTEGTIIYEVKVNMHRRLPADRAEMKSMVPEYNLSKDQLFFNPSGTLYKPLEEEEEDFEQESGAVQIRFRRPNAEIYFNPLQSKRIVLQEFMGKKYLIEDSIKISPWKLGGETKNILGYTCKQASFYNEQSKQNLTAWYADILRPFIGPENFNSLPGTVLQVDVNDGERIITALKIESRPLKKHEMKVPSGGQRVTQEEYNKITEAQMERMRANGGNIIIRN